MKTATKSSSAWLTPAPLRGDPRVQTLEKQVKTLEALLSLFRARPMAHSMEGEEAALCLALDALRDATARMLWRRTRDDESLAALDVRFRALMLEAFAFLEERDAELDG